MEVTVEKMIEALQSVHEPDLRKDIISLDLVKDMKIEEGKVSFTVMVHNPAMHNKRRMVEACELAVQRFVGKIDVDANVIPLPAERASDQRKVLPGVKNIVAIASGKGGVGKSTVTANLAVGLAKKGYKVGLVDADIYGPSMPIMFDVEGQKPAAMEVEGKTYIKPIESYGVKLLSIGFFADASQAIVWRGPMASKAINQMFADTWWGDLDYMLIDLPPGTGDIHLTLVESIPLSGALIVTTPQKVALADARKGIGMFQLPSVNVPVLGLVENMAWFTPAELPDNRYYIFGKEGGELLAENLNIPLLGQIPLVQSICEAGDLGRPAVLQEATIQAEEFEKMIANLEGILTKKEVSA